jgi:hypothetical protein
MELNTELDVMEKKEIEIQLGIEPRFSKRPQFLSFPIFVAN